MDPRRNSFLNLIASVETGVDIEFGGNLEEDDDNIQELLAAATSGKKEKKKKKKDKSVEPIIEEDNDEEIAVKKKKKKDKKKKKKKKKKGLENDEDPGESDLEMDSDDDLSLGSYPGSSSSDDDDDDDEEEEAAPSTAGLSKGVSNRALMADGQFKMPGFQRSNTAPNPGHNINSKRRNTLGAALKGFQIDVKSLQQQADGDHSESDGLDQMTSLKSNLPTLSVAGIKVKQRRRQSAFDSFLKDSSLKNNNNDGSENSK